MFRQQRSRRIVPASLALAALVALVALWGCGYDEEKPIFMAPGSYGDIAIVVSDRALIGGLDPFLADFNREYTFVISREELFNVDIYAPEDWELCQGYKNILFVWRVGDGGPVEGYLRDKLTDAGEAQARSGAGALLQLENPFGSYQHAFIAAATDRNSLLSYLRRNATDLRQRFEEKSEQRIMRRYRYEGLASDLMNRIWLKHRIFLEIPAVYRLNQDAPDGYPAVEFMRNEPSRGLTVAWSSSSDPELLLDQRPLLLELRREMGVKMHNEDIVAESLTWSRDEIGGLPAVRLEGAWASRSFDGGGPFWSWFVADVPGQRVVCIDALVYAPGLPKMDDFRRLRAIARTFSLERPQP
jgi:hypothetical protein